MFDVDNMTEEQLRAELERLKAENARLTVQASTKVTAKYNEPFIDDEGEEKGGTVGAYGLQRWPVSLRPSQWHRLFAAKDIILAECTPERIKAETEAKARLKVAKANNGKA